jgi:hypothetical protein
MRGPMPAYEIYVATTPDGRFSDWLRVSNQEPWAQMVGHRFCRDMAGDRLPEAAFLRYLRYEHAFVRGAIGIFAYALAKAPTAADQDHLIDVLVALSGEQDAYFRCTFRALGVDPEPLDPATLPPATATPVRGVTIAAEPRILWGWSHKGGGRLRSNGAPKRADQPRRSMALLVSSRSKAATLG